MKNWSKVKLSKKEEIGININAYTGEVFPYRGMIDLSSRSEVKEKKNLSKRTESKQ
ncbi:hypothetical protein [Metabacillus arenae]|uniref:Uncharacterized protein n=1 Tax=Metabacillus arenae TaxID=2771434 RepID=A0A926RWH0_9BACI|nr:hypothetical protein [Metabacillus arenae]MBD1379891.1 hypothetical protein [Metabacillus arenae]